MSFFTSLTGLNAATTQLSVTSNNIANAGTTGFKRSRSDFGDIFATSPLQKASTVVGQGTTLKQVAQEFSQGNIVLSGNSLDLAVTGDGFFPLRAADEGLQYTRSGSFMLDEDNVVVNSADQELMVYRVGEGGVIQDFEGFQRLQIPRETIGQARNTTQIDLELSFPTSANVIRQEGVLVPFDKDDPTTYFTSTNTPVFNENGENTSLTVYYQKYKDDAPGSSEEKWRTYHYLETQAEDGTTSSRLLDIKSSQATDVNGNTLFVNKYGETRTYSSLQQAGLTPSPNQTFFKYYLDDIGPQQRSEPAFVTGNLVANTQANSDGINLTTEIDALTGDGAAIENAFKFDIAFDADTNVLESTDYKTIDLYNLRQLAREPNGSSIKGDALAKFLQTEINRQMGDERKFITNSLPNTINVTLGAESTEIDLSELSDGATPEEIASFIQQKFASLDEADNPKLGAAAVTYDASVRQMKVSSLASGDELVFTSDIPFPLLGIGESLSSSTVADGDGDAAIPLVPLAPVSFKIGEISVDIPDEYPNTKSILEITRLINDSFESKGGDFESVSVKYDYELQRFQFNGLSAPMTISRDGMPFPAFGLSDDSETPFQQVIPVSGEAPSAIPTADDFLTAAADRRYGVTVEFEGNDLLGTNNGSFVIRSGSTGDTSSVKMTNTGALISSIFGFDSASDDLVTPQSVGDSAIRGLTSEPARVVSNPVSLQDGFNVNSQNNTFTVRVNDISETIEIPQREDYKVQEFIQVLEDSINRLERDGVSVSGVSIDYQQNVFTVTSGLTGDNAFLQIQGPAFFGFEDGPAATGTTSTFRKPLNSVIGGEPELVKSSSTDLADADFEALSGATASIPESEPEWRPVFFHEGELTFDGSGNLVSPRDGFQVVVNEPSLDDAGRLLEVDFAGSNQRSGSFTIASQERNGAGEGSLVAVDIADNGIVTATYSNGFADDLGAIVLANFSTPGGLRQLGDSTFLESADSGERIVKQPGTFGLGTIRAGAIERANVDLTAELVDLITAQRNFQANAKALETSSTLTSTIINIRS